MSVLKFPLKLTAHISIQCDAASLCQTIGIMARILKTDNIYKIPTSCANQHQSMRYSFCQDPNVYCSNRRLLIASEFLQVMMEGEEEEAEGDQLSRGQSRDMGSLTGWQALANEVMAELGSGRQVTNPPPEDTEEPLQVSTERTEQSMLFAVFHGRLWIDQWHPSPLIEGTREEGRGSKAPKGV